MAFLFSSIFQLLVAGFVIVFGVIGLLFGALLSLVELLLGGPFLILLVVLGLILWKPLLWLAVLVFLFFLFRIERKENYVDISRK